MAPFEPIQLFEKDNYKLLQNKQGYYKIQINQVGYWRDVTWNDTASCIAGAGNPTAQIFSKRSDAMDFITEHTIKEKTEEPEEIEFKIDQDWQEEK